MTTSDNPETLRLASWNVLHDNPPNGHRIGVKQPDRLNGITDILAGQGDLDIVGLYEVHGTQEDNPAAEIAKRLDLEQNAFSLCTFSGIVLVANGDMFEEIRTIDLDPDHEERKALVARGAGGITVAATHPSHYPLNKGRILRRRQMGTLLEHLEDDENAVIMGDLNALPRQHSRRMLENEGFVSAHTAMAAKHPPTYPADRETADIGVSPILQPIVRSALRLTKGISIDDVYIRGNPKVVDMDLLSAVVPDAKSGKKVLSDHHGLVASLQYAESDSRAQTEEVAA